MKKTHLQMKQNNKVADATFTMGGKMKIIMMLWLLSDQQESYRRQELYLKQPELNVLLIDKGQDVMKRHCDQEKKIKSNHHRTMKSGCLPACSITADLAVPVPILTVNSKYYQ